MKDLKRYTKVLLATAAVSAAMMAAPATVHAMKGPVELAEDNTYTDDQELVYKFSVSGSIATLASIDDSNFDGEEYSVDVPGSVIKNGTDTPVDVTKLGRAVFAGNTKIVNIDLSDTKIATITQMSYGKTSFEKCSNLETIKLPNTLTALPNYMFAGCGKLTEVEIPKKVVNFGLPNKAHTRIFEGCDSLKEINVAEGNTAFKSDDGVLYSADGTKLYAYPNGKKNAEFRVPDGVNMIYYGAFQTVQNLRTVYFPASLTEIGQYAFNGSGTASDTNNSLETAVFYGDKSKVKKGNGAFLSSVQQIQNATGVSITSGDTCKGSLQLTAAVEPESANNKKVMWSVDKPSVATVDDAGLLTAKAAGTVTVTATTEDTDWAGNAFTATKEVKVTPVIKSVKVSESNGQSTVEAGKTLEFIAMVNPEGSGENGVEWSVDNIALATIDENGLFTAKAAGTVTVKATSKDDSSKSDTYTVTVTDPAVESVTVSEKSGKNTVEVGKTLEFTATTSPEGSGKAGVEWSVDNTALASISESGLFTAKAAGTVTVKATSKDDSNVSGTYKVTVTEPAKSAEPEKPVKPVAPTVKPSENTTTPAATEPVKAEKASASQIKISWTKDVAAKTGYRVYVKAGHAKKWTKVAEVKSTKTSFTLKKLNGKALKAGTDYQFRITSLVNNKKAEGKQLILKASTAPGKTGLTAKKVKKATAQIKWKKVKGASGYEIQMKTSKKGSYKTVKITGKKASSFKQKGLGKTKRAYYRVRAFKVVNGKKVNGAWSTKSVKLR
nr:Ig-like domain-containing protein [uncultured Blautia sp.]